MTLHGARAEAQKVFAARLDGRDPASEKREGKRRLTADRIEEVVVLYAQKHLAGKRSEKEIRQLLDRVVVSAWRGRSVHEIGKADAILLIQEVEGRGTPYAANKLLKVLRTFFRWCVGRTILDRSPVDGIALPSREVARERTLNDGELTAVLRAARTTRDPFGAVVEMLALTGQRREEVAGMTWAELDLEAQTWTLEGARTKNRRAHIVHLSEPAVRLLRSLPRLGPFVFTARGSKPFQDFGPNKRRLDEISGVTDWRLHDLRRTVVSGLARLGVAPHIADRILNHVRGTISSVASVYQRHEFLAERKAALDLWGAHVARITAEAQG